ncbi:MAG: NUDIX domain-containing protein, partial [Gemmataceae bacterium]|nr:NUDIX domain-containing protein [Gemmataceae bacterium]
LSRLFGREEDPRGTEARRWLWSAAEAVMPAKRAGDFNQALMELGALVCTPSSPRCLACPVSARCEAFRTGRQDEIPRRDPPPEKTRVREVAVAVRREGKLLLAQRPASGRWAGLWEFPRAVVEGSDERTARRLLGSMGIEAGSWRRAGEVRHGITRFVVTVALLEAEWDRGEFRPGPYAAGAWLAAEELAERPASSPQRRLAALVT